MIGPVNALKGVNLPGMVTIVAVGGLWEATVRGRIIAYQYLPAPSTVFVDLWELLLAGTLVDRLAHTLMVTLISWVIACVVGIVLGLLLGLSDTAHGYSITSFEVLRAVPPIAFVPAALLIFGFSIRMELVISAYAGTWPLLVNTIGGVRGVPEELMDVARMLRMSRSEKIRKIVLPAAAPSILVGLRLALSMCLVLAVVAEMVGNPAGLGNGLISARQALQPGEMFAYVLVIGLLGVALNATLRFAASRALPDPVASGKRAPW